METTILIYLVASAIAVICFLVTVAACVIARGKQAEKEYERDMAFLERLEAGRRQA